MIWRIVLVVLAYLLLAAHFMRFGALLPTALLALAPLLLLARRRWSVIVLQAGLVAGVLAVWLPSTVDFIALRQASGAPWLRLAAIMSGVMLFSLLAAWSLRPLFARKPPQGGTL
ncbi:hypothetical protein KUW19_07355 [Ferrimonas balearica]|uniref:hypothetical protein n=1 Tax=Ferrimonas balearica TaxID=44012 RepID=UPI001C9873E3|nr:hypothetical protein [Ferrimonas balearica]MBY6106309.1 hypothetical protein [Ferrimonas balearica]